MTAASRTTGRWRRPRSGSPGSGHGWPARRWIVRLPRGWSRGTWCAKIPPTAVAALRSRRTIVALHVLARTRLTKSLYSRRPLALATTRRSLRRAGVRRARIPDRLTETVVTGLRLRGCRRPGTRPDRGSLPAIARKEPRVGARSWNIGHRAIRKSPAEAAGIERHPPSHQTSPLDLAPADTLHVGETAGAEIARRQAGNAIDDASVSV